MRKYTMMALLLTAFLGASTAHADTKSIENSIVKLEKHIDFVSKKFNGKLGEEETATKAKIAALYAKLEAEKTAGDKKSKVVDPEIAKLEARLKKIQDKFGLKVLDAEEAALTKKINDKKDMHK